MNIKILTMQSIKTPKRVQFEIDAKNTVLKHEHEILKHDNLYITRGQVQ